MINVQTVFLEQNFMSNTIKEIEKLCLHWDFKFLKHFTDTQQTLIHQHSNISAAEQTQIKLQKQIRLDMKFRWLSQWIWILKLQKKHAVLIKILYDYYITADLNYIVMQFKKEKSVSQIFTFINYIITDHNWLINNLFFLMINEFFINIMKTMFHLCSQTKNTDQQNFSVVKHVNHSFMHNSRFGSNILKFFSEFNINI